MKNKKNLSIPHRFITDWANRAAVLGDAAAGLRIELNALDYDASPHTLMRAANAAHYAVTQLVGDQAKVAAALLADIDEARAKPERFAG